ncbi:hypothetical protein AHF37_00307 [Paragonimus kellicotti]|nr:hypothetical protein AHF37_00307 [Paragonimus kellicotti]
MELFGEFLKFPSVFELFAMIFKGQQHLANALKLITEAAPVTDTSQPGDELSLDRFFHLSGMDPAQLEALCNTEYSEGGSEVLFQSDAEKKYPLERPSTSNHKNTSNTASDQRSRIDESESYRRKLAAYQEGQQKQAELIQKLQTKVMQYKKRTSDLELEVEQLKSELEASDKVVSS